MIFLVGGNGLVGSAFKKYFKQNKIKFTNIQRYNQNSFKNKSCEILIYANGNPNKTLAEKDPQLDFNKTVTSIIFYLNNIKFKKFIFFSSVDVYANTNKRNFTSEKVLVKSESVYGINKIISETYVKKFAKNYLIFRLGGLVGDKLKKNPIYDIFNRNKIFTSVRSEMNFIHTDFLPKIIFKIIEKRIKNEIFNLASLDSIKISKILKLYSIKKIQLFKSYKNKIQIYKINTKKISKYVKLPKTGTSIKKYFESINKKQKT
tara:strand:- start:2904 stop:3686 length:783 start_codon:yes stop_codon:yes gene_type:complete